MKKNTTLFALGILLCSQVLPIAAHANTAINISDISSDGPPITDIVDTNDLESIVITDEKEVSELDNILESEDIDSGKNEPLLATISENGGGIAKYSSEQKIVDKSNEPLDEWMPDKNLQEFVANYLGVDKSLITPDFLNDKVMYVTYTDAPEFFYMESYEGLDNFEHIYLSVSIPYRDESYYELKSKPINWGLLDGNHFSIAAGGDLTVIFPEGIDVKDDRLSIDPHNQSFLMDVYLNQNNYDSFFISYSELKLLNAEPSDFIYSSELYVTSENLLVSYSTKATESGIEFTLNNDLDYNDVSGNSYVNVEDDYLDFPNGPFFQTRVSNSTYINSRLNIHYYIPGEDVIVKYIDDSNPSVELDDITHISGGIGEKYITSQKDFEGYTFKEVVGNATGVFTSEAQTVTYVYSKDIAPVTSSVEVKYVDEAGDEIADSEILTGKVGDMYEAKQKSIENYTFKEVKGNSKGVFTQESQNVTYIYTKNDDKVTPTITEKGDGGTSPETLAIDRTSSNKGNLPSTGDQTLFPPLLIGSFFVSLAAAVFALKRKKDL